MNKTKSILRLAISIAIVFTFSCSGDDDSDKSKGKGNNIANYKTIQIGVQVWMAENLDYHITGSDCWDVDPAYGCLYSWATAMALPSGCNSSSCASQISTKHRGICPSGWHIPSDAEWTKLIDFIGGSAKAGTRLKATSGWEDYDGGKSGNGTDNFSFSALPAGTGGICSGCGRCMAGYAGFFGYFGSWWTATEHDDCLAYNYEIYNDSAKVYSFGTVKNDLYSVRCVQD